MEPQNIPTASPELDAKQIVSVNSRGGSANALLPKILFTTLVVGVALIGALVGVNKYRANKKAVEALTEQTAKNENKPAQVGQRRVFEAQPPVGATADQSMGASAANGKTPLCSDGTIGTVMLGADSKPILSADGSQMRVCRDGHVLVKNVPALAGAAPIPLSGPTQGGSFGGGQGGGQSKTRPPSRFDGDVMVEAPASLAGGLTGPGASKSSTSETRALAMEMLQNQLSGKPTGATTAASFTGAAVPAVQPPSPAPERGSLGGELNASTSTPTVRAVMLGDRNMILPKGRSIDCGLSMRLVSDVSGLASCVLPQNIYSDNGKVLLLERGSEATGEYKNTIMQGQTRIFVLWNRIKTPSGVVINLNSPGSDALGTGGLTGFVDNHWFERLGAAFLLSIIEDAIAYKTAEASGGSTTGAVAFQNTSQTGNTMAEKILESTINIKPTIYVNQGDRGSIYVAHDLDFSTVYALRAR